MVTLFVCCKTEPKIKGNFVVENQCNEEIVVRTLVSKRTGNNPPVESEITDYIAPNQFVIIRTLHHLNKDEDPDIKNVVKELEIKKQEQLTNKDVFENSLWERKEKSEEEADFVLKVDSTFF